MDTNFIDDLIADAEANEHKQTLAYFDLLVGEIARLESDISKNFEEAEREIQLINNWVLMKNTRLKERVDFIRLKLEKFIREEGQKTIDLPHGTLKLHKKPDKVEISDMAAFLAGAKAEMLNVIPEQVKPDLTKIKASIKKYGVIPEGVSFIEGKEELSLKLKDNASAADKPLKPELKMAV